MPISKIKSSSITADAASTNLNIDANTLFLDATNNRIGIGTTTPSQKLHVNVDSGNVYEQISSGANNVYLGFESARTASVVQSNNALVFDVGSSYTERMRIDSAGKVGIGTTAPDLALDVYGNAGTNGAANRIMVLQTNNTATEGYGGGIAFGGYYDGTTSRVNDFAGIQGFKENNTAGNYAGALRFTTRVNGGSPTERFRIDSSGNVVIGVVNDNVASANQRLLITGSPEGATLHGMFIHNNSYSAASARIALSPRYSFFYNTSPYIQAVSESTSAAALTFGTTTGGAVSERMRITSSGNLGIGTTDPQDMLDVSGSARIGQGQVSSNATVGTLGIYSGMTFNTGNAQLKFFGKSVDNTGLTYELGRISSGSIGSAYTIGGGLIFSTASNNGANVMTLSPRMYITATGYVGIGNDAPGSPLDVTFTSDTVYDSANTLTSGQNTRISNLSTTAGIATTLLFNPKGGGGGNGLATISGVNTGTGSTAITFGTRNSGGSVTERTRIMSTGQLLIGQTTTYNGAGISIQPNLATAAVGINGNFATVWNIPTGTCGLFTVHMGGNGQYGGAALFFVTWGSAAGINNASITQIVGPQGDQSGYNWSYNLQSNGQFQMRNNTNSVNFTPVINLITLG